MLFSQRMQSFLTVHTQLHIRSPVLYPQDNDTHICNSVSSGRIFFQCMMHRTKLFLEMSSYSAWFYYEKINQCEHRIQNQIVLIQWFLKRICFLTPEISSSIYVCPTRNDKFKFKIVLEESRDLLVPSPSFIHIRIRSRLFFLICNK